MAAISHQELKDRQLVENHDGEPELPDRHARQLSLDLGYHPALTHADFLVSEANALAFEHLQAYPSWPGPLTVITGPAKSGKTHLAHIWADRAGAFMAGAGDLEKLAGTGGQQPVVVEDIDRRGYEEQAVFHLLNQSMRFNRPLLMTARAGIREWPFKTADVLSRARLAAHFSLEMPDDIQLSQMFVKLFGDRQITVDPKIISYLVARMERSAEAVYRLVALMDKLALSRRTPVTRSVAAEALKILDEIAGRDPSNE